MRQALLIAFFSLLAVDAYSAEKMEGRKLASEVSSRTCEQLGDDREPLMNSVRTMKKKIRDEKSINERERLLDQFDLIHRKLALVDTEILRRCPGWFRD